MEKGMTYDIGSAKYAANKLMRAFKKKDLNNPHITDYLSTILIFADKSYIKEIKMVAQEVVDYLMTGQGVFDDIFDSVQLLDEQLSKINEKRRVMKVRHNAACRKFQNKMNGTDYKDCPSALNVYDVVKVPTEGGMHYSIISEINDEFVTCFPMTTASRKDLGLIGTRSVSLSDCGDDSYKVIRLTATATKVALKDAIRSYIGSVASNPHICEKLARVVSFA